MFRVGVLVLSVLLAPCLSAQESGSGQTQEEKNLRSVLIDMKRGTISESEAFSELDNMADEPRYENYVGPHIMLAALSDVYAPNESERIFRRALSSLEGKEFVVFLMRNFDRAMELDRNYIYDDERIKTDAEYRKFWEQRQFYDFTVSEFDALADCHSIFSEKDEWRESTLKQIVSEEPCSKLKDF